MLTQKVNAFEIKENSIVACTDRSTFRSYLKFVTVFFYACRGADSVAVQYLGITNKGDKMLLPNKPTLKWPGHDNSTIHDDAESQVGAIDQPNVASNDDVPETCH
jgi:hypothetical protein